MPTTPLRGYPFPGGAEAPSGPFAFEQLALAVEADTENIADDVAELKTLKRSEWEFGAQAAPTNQVWSVGTLLNRPAATTDTVFTTTTATPGQIQINETGTYAAAVIGAFTILPARRCFVQIQSSAWPHPIRRNIFPGEDIGGVEAPVFTVTAGTKLTFSFFNDFDGAGTVEFNGRINIVKWAEA